MHLYIVQNLFGFYYITLSLGTDRWKITHKYLYPNIETQISNKSKLVFFYVDKQEKMVLDKAPFWTRLSNRTWFIFIII